MGLPLWMRTSCEWDWTSTITRSCFDSQIYLFIPCTQIELPSLTRQSSLSSHKGWSKTPQELLHPCFGTIEQITNSSIEFC